MNNQKTAMGVFVLLCIACVVHALCYYPRLPAQVAQHFGAFGQPDAWGSKMQFLIMHVVTISFMAAMILGSGLGMTKIPNSMINVPNKDYWLAPERREQTVAYIQSRLLWLGSCVMIFWLDLAHQSFQVHLGAATKLNHVWVSSTILLTVSAMWCMVIYMKFRKTKSQPSTPGYRR
jgi:uncharacterized membrane protein